MVFYEPWHASGRHCEGENEVWRTARAKTNFCGATGRKSIFGSNQAKMNFGRAAGRKCILAGLALLACTLPFFLRSLLYRDPTSIRKPSTQFGLPGYLCPPPLKGFAQPLMVNLDGFTLLDFSHCLMASFWNVLSEEGPQLCRNITCKSFQSATRTEGRRSTCWGVGMGHTKGVPSNEYGIP